MPGARAVAVSRFGAADQAAGGRLGRGSDGGRHILQREDGGGDWAQDHHRGRKAAPTGHNYSSLCGVAAPRRPPLLLLMCHHCTLPCHRSSLPAKGEQRGRGGEAEEGLAQLESEM
jgi:hypothetical protein